MKEKLKKINTGAILGILFALGVALVLLSGKKAVPEDKEIEVIFNESLYEESLEIRLKNILEKIDGVGTVSVMITLDGSALYNYATDTAYDIKSDGDSRKESSVVLSVNGSNTKEAVVSGYSLPNVKGAAVVCSETLSPTLQSKVIGVVSASLGISTGKIFVTN